MSSVIDIVSRLLRYEGDPGFVRANEFSHQPNHRHALRVAKQLMHVCAAFGLWTGRNGALLGPEQARFTPLVFLVDVSDREQAREVHRSVWSQGLAPYLIAASSDHIWVCQGFSYSSSEWKRHAVEISLNVLDIENEISQHQALTPLFAKSLRSSLAWRDEARTADEFVDERLLRSLGDLSIAFSAPAHGRQAIDPAVSNALIARLLYFYFLVDRKFITLARLEEWDLQNIDLARGAVWTLSDVRGLFARLDEVFNGSIFPMPAAYADAYDASHVNLLKEVLRHGADLGAHGALQLSFEDYDFASIRTETLSAIYEMFLHNEDQDAGRHLGAFYTPPYLVDYTLDRIEDVRPIDASTRVLDPATGSGVFLVGAYRRIVEASLVAGETRLSLEALHKLMTDNIFGVELNATACHVAAFSLYLTMLDYVDAREAADFTRWPISVGQPRLFPSMLKGTQDVSANIRNGDFFSETSQNLDCDLVVGNPPWVQLGKLHSEHATSYYLRTRPPIGDKQSAELFLWKAYVDHLADGGMLGILIPQKSLVNKSSDRFIRTLRRDANIIGVADLAHLRYVLFRRSNVRAAGANMRHVSRGARQATAVVMLRKAIPSSGQKFWIYRPLRSTQPASRKGRLWTLLHDWTQVTWQDSSAITDNDWRRLFSCSPIDRRILQKIDRQIASGKMHSLHQLKTEVGLEFKIEVDQGLDKSVVLSSDPKLPTFWRRQLGLEPSLIQDPSIVPLPAAEIEKAYPSSRPFLMGNVVLMPRTCETALFVEQPVATSFFIVGCFTALAGYKLPVKHRLFIEAIAAYMSTDVFRYLCIVNSRRMMIDRASVELSTVVELPWPFGTVENGKWDEFASLPRAEREKAACKALGLPEVYKDLVQEFINFREDFADGHTPPEALRSYRPADIEAYLGALIHEIDAGRGRYNAEIVRVGNDIVAAVISYQANRQETRYSAQQFVSIATNAYVAQGASTLTQSRYLWHSRDAMTSVLIKPKERMHWTIDRAFADADLIAAAVMSGYSHAGIT